MSDRAQAKATMGSLRRFPGRLSPKLRVVAAEDAGRAWAPSADRAHLRGRKEPRRRRLVRMSGYAPRWPWLSRLWNIAVGLVLVAVCLPLLATIATVLMLTQGPRKVFYTGERIGKDGKPFRIFKFRTLRDDARHVTGNQVLPANSGLETPIGRHLRDTRLDELPQLVNVLRGDINMFGPRPVRAAIAAQCRKTIPGYDVRFQVKPGLIGYSQALMPHGTDKRIRARLNARLCRSEADLLQEALFIAVTGLSVLAWTARVAAGVALSRRLAEQWRDSVRVDGDAQVVLACGTTLTLRLLRADGEKLLLEADRPLPQTDQPYLLRLRPRRRLRPPGKTARCTAVLLASEMPSQVGRAGPLFRYTMRYAPVSSFERYLIDRYVLRRVVVR